MYWVKQYPKKLKRNCGQMSKLRISEEKTKVLILLSDGKPLDRDYFGNYAIEDTRMALRAEVLYQVVLYRR